MQITGLVKSAILYFYVKINVNWGDYLLSMEVNMYMFEMLHNVHVVANISVNCHKLCYLCIHCHFNLEINFIKIDLNNLFSVQFKYYDKITNW